MTRDTRPAIHIRIATTDDMAFILSLVPRFVAFELPKGRRKRETAAAIRADPAVREIYLGTGSTQQGAAG